MYPRFSEILVRSALRDTRVVAISGPRQSGKTTLARRFAQQGRIYVTLDNQPTLAAAKSDPEFISKIFRGQLPQPAESFAGNKLLQAVATGGYPDAIKRRAERRRDAWYRAYIKSIAERDIPEIADIANPGQIHDCWNSQLSLQVS